MAGRKDRALFHDVVRGSCDGCTMVIGSGEVGIDFGHLWLDILCCTVTGERVLCGGLEYEYIQCTISMGERKRLEFSDSI